MPYPNETGFRSGSETSRKTAKILDETGRAQSQKEFILRDLDQRGDLGSTVDRMTRKMQLEGFPTIHNGTVAGRFCHLENMFLIKKTDRVAKTVSGKDAVIYVRHDGTPFEIRKSKRESMVEDVTMAANFINALIAGNKIDCKAYGKIALEHVTKLRHIAEEMK